MPSGQACQEDFPGVLVQQMILHIRVAKAPVCNLPLIYTPCPWAVPIIPLPGITLANFASRHVEQWFHISRAKLCYQSQFLPPSQVAITLDYRYLVPSSLATPTRGIL